MRVGLEAQRRGWGVAFVGARLGLALLSAAPRGLCATTAQGPAAVPLSASDALGIKSFVIGAALALSPNERWVSYSVIDPTRRRGGGLAFTRTGVPVSVEGSEVHVAGVATRSDRLIDGQTGTSSWGGVWSPDSRHLAYLSDRGGAVHVWVWDEASGRTRRLARAAVFTLLPHEAIQWTPDGRRLVVKLLPEGSTLASVLGTGEPGPRRPVDRTMPNDRVSPGSRLATVTVFRSGMAGSGTPGSESVAPWVTDSITAFSRYRGDLGVIDVASGAVRRLARAVPTTGYWLSPNGAWLAYTRYRADAPAAANLFDLVVVSVSDGASQIIARGISQSFGRSVSWAPNGAMLAFLHNVPAAAGGHAADALPTGACFVADLSGGDPPRQVCGTGRFGGRGGVGDPPPVWGATSAEFYLVARDTVWRVPVAGGGPSAIGTLAGRELLGIVGQERLGRAWMPHGPGSLYVQFRDAASLKVGFATIDVAGGTATSLTEEDKSYPPQSYGGVDAAGTTVVYLAEDTQHPAEVWTSGADFVVRREVTNANPQLSRYRFGEGRLIRWRSSDGTQLTGALILPSGYQPGHACPLVVRVYGGTRQSRFANTFVGAGDVFVMQLFATRGFAVFMPDIPQRSATPMRDIAAAVLPGIDRLVDLGIADPDRLGILGHSYGGYSVLALLVQTNRFRAALASAGFSDLVSGYRSLWPGGGSIEASIEGGQGLMGGSVWQYRERFIENSPFYYLDRVETPVLLIHGTEDTLPVTDSDQTFVALRRLGKTVEYARYEGEGHAAWGAPNATD